MTYRLSYRAFQKGAEIRQLSPLEKINGNDSYHNSPCFVSYVGGRNRLSSALWFGCPFTQDWGLI